MSRKPFFCVFHSGDGGDGGGDGVGVGGDCGGDGVGVDGIVVVQLGDR